MCNYPVSWIDVNLFLYIGLVIVKALYGHSQNLETEAEEGVIDVTMVIQTLVHESRLTIPGGHSKVTEYTNNTF